MDLGKSQQLRLAPTDEYTHPIEAARNFNESMYINLFDPKQRMGGWFRVGNRPNEGYAEMSCCVYLPGGQVAFMFARPSISGNEALSAGGMRFQVIEPFKRLSLTYRGKVCLLQNPLDMEDPKLAFKNNPHVDCEIDLTFDAVAPVFGGEAVDEQGKPIEEAADEAFARAHYEQHMSGHGRIKVGDEQHELQGFGLRDHSWGPRYWQNLYWYRWLPMNFGCDFAMNIAIVQMASGRQHVWGMVLKNGEYELIESATLTTEYDERYYPWQYSAHVKTANETYEVSARVLSLIPLRNRRQRDDGNWMQTRIIEGHTEFSCKGLTGFGMTEYLDQMAEGVPVGYPL